MANKAWDNICEHVVALRSEDEYVQFYALLKEYGGTNISNTPYIEFETEAQKAWFLLRWS